MDNSLSSSINTALNASSKPTADHDAPAEEESGWTSYFEDFSNHIIEHSYYSTSRYGGSNSSIVSDAASCVAWKITNNNRSSSIDGSPKIPQKLSFKQTRTKEISYDDSLEDTASSPVNSPKVSDLKQMDMNPRKTDDNMDSSLGKGGSSDHESQVQKNEGNGMNFNGKKSDCTDLRKKGLCLVPLSMLVNYLG